MSLRLDLHTHSYGSPDGGLSTADYRQMLESGKLDCIAITDHGNIDVAQKILADLDGLSDRIIVGEEIKTTDGEIIGLYLSETIPEGLTPAETVAAIREQNGLVYVPHPFETVRSGISEKGLTAIIADVDIIEICNGRAIFQDRGKEAKQWAKQYKIASAASSDAHGRRGWGRTYSVLHVVPTRENLTQLLSTATYGFKKVGLGVLYPKLNRVKRINFVA